MKRRTKRVQAVGVVMDDSNAVFKFSVATGGMSLGGDGIVTLRIGRLKAGRSNDVIGALSKAGVRMPGAYPQPPKR